MLVLSTIRDTQDQNIVNACSQNLKSEMQCHGVCSIYKVEKDGFSRVLCDCTTALL